MDNAQILSWIVGAIGIGGFFLAGRKVWWCWYVNIACQVFWALYAIASETPAFFVTAGFYTVVFGWNAYKWTKEHRRTRGWQDPSEVSEPDSNLVRHARVELTRLGEHPHTIDLYLEVIRAFSKMGHSGSSARFATPVILKLLQFEPLMPLTNDPNEWQYHGEEVWGEKNGIWQNRRDGRMFSSDGGLTYTSVEDPKDASGNKTVYCSQIFTETPAQV
jgi:hypothetical protein